MSVIVSRSRELAGMQDIDSEVWRWIIGEELDDFLQDELKRREGEKNEKTASLDTESL
ncbi:MAG: hypothetical protein JW882_13470 [Deltaproteobacteria bacterium]|nr:hypothetical protein [Deltaproteobacteria bacterium]